MWNNINDMMFKNIGSVNVITSLTNAIIRLEYFSAMWKEAEVLIIAEEDAKFSQNYKSISLQFAKGQKKY